jgi:hypothetical protein
MGSRYTLQWLTPGDEFCLRFFPDNSDASFVSPRKPKPAEVLLHYNYGAASVKTWGRNHAILSNRTGVPRPQEPKAEPLGPTKSVGDRSKAINKLEKARAEEGQGLPPNDGGSASSGAGADSQPRWDEHDVMLFFWGNSKLSTQRHAEKDREREENVIAWRAGVSA